MFRLQRNKPDKSGERIDFNLSNIQAIRVPKGWDKLFVSIIFVETGKTIVKSSKALVQNGYCQWTETLSVFIWVSQDDASKEIEECLFKLVVATGSARSGVLGEAIVNLTGYMSSRASVPLSLPLKKCNHGTVLQVKIQCLTPLAILRDEQWKEAYSQLEDLHSDYDDMDNKSDGSRSVESFSSNHLGCTSHPGELGSRSPSFSASGSHHSSDSVEGSIGWKNCSPRNNLTGDVYNLIGRQDSTEFQYCAPYGVFPVEDAFRSNQSSFNSWATGSGDHLQNEFGQSSTSPLKNSGSSKAAEYAIEEIRAVAKMWERNARKLMLDLEVMRNETSEQSRHHADLERGLSVANTECASLKEQIEKLKKLLEESMVKQTSTENSKFQMEGRTHIQKELGDEIKSQHESNSNFSIQLKETQVSNIELVSPLQEQVEIIEKQRVEIDDLSALKFKFGDQEICSHENEDNGIQNSTKEVSNKKTGKASTDSDLKVSDVESTVKKFHEEAGAEEKRNLELQLKELQDSQKSLQTTVQLLEKILEVKNNEIEVERNLRNQTLLDIEAEWRCKLSTKEETIINLEAKLSESLNAQCSEEKGLANVSDPDLLKEIEALKAKVQELERYCNGLADENLELILNLKESKKDLLTEGTSFNSLPNKTNVSADTSESEVSDLKSQIYQLGLELKKKEVLSEGNATGHLQIQLTDLQNKCTDLELQLQSFKDKACDLDAQLHRSQDRVEEQESRISELQKQLESYQERKTDREDQFTVSCTRFENFESNIHIEMPKLLSDLNKQLQLALAHVKKPWYNICSHVNTECEIDVDNLANFNSVDIITQKKQAEVILNNFVRLNKLLEAKITECEELLQSSEVVMREKDENLTEAQKKLEDCNLKVNAFYLSIQEVKSLKMELETKVADLSRELIEERSEIQELEASLSLKGEEIEVLRHSKRELESQVYNLQKEKGHLEERMETVLRESRINSNYLDEIVNDLMVLRSSLDSQVSANKILESKSSELECGKRELEIHLSEVEEENIQLSERISGLEAQLRYLTDERGFSKLEIENSKSYAKSLQDEIGRLGIEMKTQEVDLRQKVQDMQKWWSEAQEEYEHLKRANPKLQAMAESLIEECNSLRTTNGELRKRNLELHETRLEVKLRESQKSFSDCFKIVEAIEANLSTMQDDIASKEKFLTSELDALLHENKEHKDKLILEERLLNQMYLEKTVEVKNLQREVAHLTEQISPTHDERDRIVPAAVLEVSSLRADKAKLETALQEAQAKVKSSENELDILRVEARAKVEGLICELAASKQNQELLMANHEKLLRSLEDVKASEEKLKSTLNVLKRKLTASEQERQQLQEEITSLKVRLWKTAHLQDEVLGLKSLLNKTQFEKQKLEASLQLLSGYCEEMKAERLSLLEKISSMHMAVSELEDCRCTRVALEEKLLQLEGDLMEREASCAQNAKLKNDLSQIKRANSQFQQRIQHLEEEKDKCLKKAQALEEELKLKKEEKQGQSESRNKDLSDFSESNTKVISIHEELKFAENEKEKDTNQCQEIWRPSMDIVHLQELSEVQQSLDSNQFQREGNNFHLDHNGKFQVIGSKIQFLQNEHAEPLETNNMYNIQHWELLSKEQDDHSDAAKKLASEGEIVTKEAYECKTSSLEAELKDIRERYLYMSTRYAEVEAQREELVMKLKSLENVKR